METNFRQQQIQIVLNRFMLSLNCTSQIAESLLAGIDGLKIQGIHNNERLGYVNQLMYKLGVQPTEVGLSSIGTYLDSRSILCDIPEKARQFCNQVFPFIGALSYSLSPASQASSMRHDSLVPARHVKRAEPIKVVDFYFIEQNMPPKFFVMAHNSKVPSILEHGIPGSRNHHTKLWASKVQAQDSFLGGIDGLHTRSPSLTGWGGMNDYDKGTLISVNSSYVVRDPAKFYPVHRMAAFIAMAYAQDLPPAALKVESLVDSDVMDMNIYDAELGVLDAENQNPNQ